ncbi:polysaccharide biosynthesis/export family protein [Chitinispirillales bacterium ANBcel5]|uniref:polysaccharide biosynthesis/export family protein n=1 Tax=Cellulosispirillum alkaliphilum TaxID=3039283 RepID=UPI002A549B22|nr:polysaccharide biosynthesis/export family protein [Chitinispirillales bacterium ANBcel5]
MFYKSLETFFRTALAATFFFSIAVLAQEEQSQVEFIKGDAVRISVFPETEHFLNGIYPIDSNGEIILPLIGRYNISSMSNTQLSSFLQSTYQQYLRFPEVQVTPLMRISMLGGFDQPGMYYIEPQRSLWDLVHLTGGPNFEDGLKRMRWERGRELVSKDLIPILESGMSLKDAGFRTGDQVWTPDEAKEGFWSSVVRDVVIRDILPMATFTLSLFVSLATIRNNSD